MDYLEAYHLGLDLMKKAGFELSQVSKISETCYYAHPSRQPFLLRVSTHTSKRGPMGLRSNTLARATFSRKETHEFSLVATFLATRSHQITTAKKELGSSTQRCRPGRMGPVTRPRQTMRRVVEMMPTSRFQRRSSGGKSHLRKPDGELRPGRHR